MMRNEDDRNVGVLYLLEEMRTWDARMERNQSPAVVSSENRDRTRSLQLTPTISTAGRRGSQISISTDNDDTAITNSTTSTLHSVPTSSQSLTAIAITKLLIKLPSGRSVPSDTFWSGRGLGSHRHHLHLICLRRAERGVWRGLWRQRGRGRKDDGEG
ncbi:hypothetical protein BC829DRAFT_72811 [Chytridium lagenaria]|nr:hypothetical protein BC829DRAFT_72811 [Chytridium lagenaria]